MFDRYVLIAGFGVFTLSGASSTASADCEEMPTGEPGSGLVFSLELGTLDWLGGLSDEDLVVLSDEDPCRLPRIRVTPPQGGGGGGGAGGGPPSGGAGGGGGGGGEPGGGGGGPGSLDFPHTIGVVGQCASDEHTREQQTGLAYVATYQLSPPFCPGGHNFQHQYFQMQFLRSDGTLTAGIYQRSDSACGSSRMFHEIVAPNC
jgi:hypothetical protein